MSATRILVIDDDPALRRLMHTYLTRLGYDVLTAEELHESVRLLRTDDEIQLAIADLSLMDGAQSVAALARTRPDARVLVCSGMPFEVEVLPEDVRNRCSFLQKPFLPKMLAEAVESLLAARAS